MKKHKPALLLWIALWSWSVASCVVNTDPIYERECQQDSDCAPCRCVEGFCAQGSACEASGAPAGFVRVAAGSFQMGSPAGEPGRGPEELRRRVTLTRDFWIGEAEVTQREWRALLGNAPAELGDCGDDCPVEGVNWWEALAYANARSRADGLPECFALSGCQRAPGEDMECTSVTIRGGDLYGCQGWRLPSEAEWEYAARGGADTAFYNGAPGGDGGCADEVLEDVAWFCGNSDESTNPVKKKPANQYGLYDAHGNVSEWVYDAFLEDLSALPTTDPVSEEPGDRVHRGGSWSDEAARCRSAARGVECPEVGNNNLGFRLARTAP